MPPGSRQLLAKAVPKCLIDLARPRIGIGKDNGASAFPDAVSINQVIEFILHVPIHTRRRKRRQDWKAQQIGVHVRLTYAVDVAKLVDPSVVDVMRMDEQGLIRTE